MTARRATEDAGSGSLLALAVLGCTIAALALVIPLAVGLGLR